MPPLTPEQRARESIDALLIAAGWIIQDNADFNRNAGEGVAVREFPLPNGPCDYLLIVGGKAAGVVEAKKAILVRNLRARSMERLFTMILGAMVVGAAFGQGVQQPTPENLHLLEGKHVLVGRMALCVPKTYTANMKYVGKPAIVVAFKANSTMPKMSSATLDHQSPNLRTMFEDVQRGGTLLFRFEDGTELDSCVDLGRNALIQNIELAPGETIDSPAVVAVVAPLSPTSSSGAVIPQQCSVMVTKVTSGSGGFGHQLVEALTTSELQRQVDEATHNGEGKHWLDVRVRNISDKGVVAFEMVAIYFDKMGDETTSATFVSQNSDSIKPGAEYKISAMDRSAWSQTGVGEVTLYISRVRFPDGTFWRDDGSQSCSLTNQAR